MEKRYARAHVKMYLTHDMWKARNKQVPNCTPNFNTIGQAIPEIQKRDVHVHTTAHYVCTTACTATNGPILQTKFEQNRPGRNSEAANKTFATPLRRHTPRATMGIKGTVSPSYKSSNVGIFFRTCSPGSAEYSCGLNSLKFVAI